MTVVGTWIWVSLTISNRFFLKYNWKLTNKTSILIQSDARLVRYYVGWNTFRDETTFYITPIVHLHNDFYYHLIDFYKAFIMQLQISFI